MCVPPGTPLAERLTDPTKRIDRHAGPANVGAYIRMAEEHERLDRIERPPKKQWLCEPERLGESARRTFPREEDKGQRPNESDEVRPRPGIGRAHRVEHVKACSDNTSTGGQSLVRSARQRFSSLVHDPTTRRHQEGKATRQE